MKIYKFENKEERAQFYENFGAAVSFVAVVIICLFILVVYDTVFNI